MGYLQRKDKDIDIPSKVQVRSPYKTINQKKGKQETMEKINCQLTQTLN